MSTVSIIIPCYNESESLPIFYREAAKILNSLDEEYELIFVNDGSSDDTLSQLRELSNKDNHVVYLSFSRNFGKEAAILAGLENSTGDFVTLMDDDLQDPPHLLK